MKKNQNIDTPELSINGNIMTWQGSAIQLSNISSITAVELPLIPFPKWILLAFLPGAVLFKHVRIAALLCVAAAALYLLYWHHQNTVIKNAGKLLILMNAGATFSFYFRDNRFLNRVVSVLLAIIAEGIKEERNVKINMNHCTISGNAKVLNDIAV